MYSFGRIQSQASNIDSIKYCTLTVGTDGSEDLLIHITKPHQSLDRLKELYYVRREDHSEGLTRTKKPISDPRFGKKLDKRSSQSSALLK